MVAFAVLNLFLIASLNMPSFSKTNYRKSKLRRSPVKSAAITKSQDGNVWLVGVTTLDMVLLC